MLRKVAKIAENPGADWNGVWLNGKPRLTGSGSVEYRAYCDSRNDNPYEFYASSKLPQPGAFYRNSGVRYSGFSATYDGRRDGFFCWRMNYSLGGAPESSADESGGDESENAENETILTIDASPESESCALPFDLDGAANVNSLGEWFDDPLNVEFGRLALTFKRRERSNPWPRALEFWNAINSEPIWGCLPATLKVKAIVPSLELTTGGRRWNVLYSIVYRSLGWLVKRADAGFYATGPRGVYRVLNDDGSPKESPTLLNGAGAELAPGAEPVYRTFRVNPWKDFATLNLPNPFDPSV